MFGRFCWIAAAILALQGIASAQAPSTTVGQHLSPLQSLVLPPVPSDPLELVTGDALPVQDADQRAAAIALVTNARDLSNVRFQPYDLKTTFTAFGSSPSEGKWSLEDMSPARNIYRWTAQGPSYSAIYLRTDELLSSNQQSGAMPLRLAQARRAIFFLYPLIGRYASLRTATGYLNGTELRCVLVGNVAPGRAFTGGRSWEETEYCVDPNSGLLVIYSPAPGLYVRYDYTNAFHFHKSIIPGGFTIFEAGRTVVEARTESVTDPPPANSPVFDRSGLSPAGVGMAMGPAVWIHGFVGHGARASAVASPQLAVQLVVLHGIVLPDGHLTETEILASTDSSLNQAALDHASKWENGASEGQPGTTPESQEFIYLVEFLTPAK